MRDPKRIPIIIKKLEEAWNREPNWRLGQLVSNLMGIGVQDVFHPEDEQWEKMLDEFNTLTSPNNLSDTTGD